MREVLHLEVLLLRKALIFFCLLTHIHYWNIKFLGLTPLNSSINL